MAQFPLDDDFQSIPHQPKPGADRVGYWLFRPEADRLTAELDIQSFTGDMVKRMTEAEDDFLAGVIVAEMRRRGYTVTPPPDQQDFIQDGIRIHALTKIEYVIADPRGGWLEGVFDTIDEAVKHGRDQMELPPFAEQWEVDRHAEKQQQPYSDAWRYFERQGYDMSRVDPQYD